MARRSKRVRSLAAKKGWQTRRAHARKRSAAARKGWQTRRRNEKRAGQQEYQVNVKYRNTQNAAAKVEVQISATGPSGASKSQVIQAVESRRRTGSNPPGWKIDIAVWKKGKKTFKSEEGWTELGFFINESEKEVR